MVTSLAYRIGMLLLGGSLVAACSAPIPGPSGASAPSAPVAASLPPAPTPVLTAPAGAPSPSAQGATPTPRPLTVPALEGRLTCGAPDLEFPPEALAQPISAELGQSAPAAALRAYLAADTPDEGSLPKTGWLAVIVEPARVVFLAPDVDGWTMASFVLADDGTWQDWDRGACRLQVVLPAGIGFAEWRPDPARLPAPGATTLHVLATEMACASGKAPLGRLLAPIVLEGVDAVTVVLEVRTRPGGQDCPGNPEVPVDVELAAPLGTRHVFDGSTVPPTERLP